jgi:HK97 family phage major capsid protein
MDQNIKDQMDQITAQLDARIEKAMGQAKDSATGEADVALKNEIAALELKFNGINERIDASEVSMKKNFSASEPKSFKYALAKALSDGAVEGMVKGKDRSASFEVKADMTVAANFTGEVIPADRVAGYKFDPTRPVHVRQLIPLGSTTSDVVRFVKESAYTNAAAPKAQGASAAQSEFDMTAADANVRSIETYFRISKEMLADTPQLTSYLSARAPQKLLEVEDTQILSGSGTGVNLSGIITDATAFAAGGFATAVPSPNQFDVLVVAINQLALANYTADYIMLNPTDFHKILLLKSTTSEYLAKQVYTGLAPNFMGIPVVINTAIPTGDYLVGNFAMGTQLWVRENISVEFFREDSDNVTKGFVTVLVSERVALTNYLPKGFVTGDFATDITAITPA